MWKGFRLAFSIGFGIHCFYFRDHGFWRIRYGRQPIAFASFRFHWFAKVIEHCSRLIEPPSSKEKKKTEKRRNYCRMTVLSSIMRMKK